jgi:hypothetical protein
MVSTPEQRADIRRIKAENRLTFNAREWLREETEMRWFLGCPPFELRDVLVFMVEAARKLCGGDTDSALKLLDKAVSRLRQERRNNGTEH